MIFSIFCFVLSHSLFSRLQQSDITCSIFQLKYSSICTKPSTCYLLRNLLLTLFIHFSGNNKFCSVISSKISFFSWHPKKKTYLIVEQFEKKTVKNRISKTAPFPNKILRDIFNLFFQLFFILAKFCKMTK